MHCPASAAGVPASGGSQALSGPTRMPAMAARQALSYETPSQPHTGADGAAHASGRAIQVPKSVQVVPAQYSSDPDETLVHSEFDVQASGPPSDDGIGGSGNGDGNGIGGDGGGSKYGWYAAEVQARIADALRQNAKTRDVSLKIKVRIWSDSSGRITRAEISGSSGDPAVDIAIKTEVLTGLQLQEPPPQDMPMPIVMMIREQRPS